MRTCSEGRGNLCAHINFPRVKRTTVEKGRWVRGRLKMRGPPGNRYMHRSRRFVRFKKPRRVTYYETHAVYCKATRLGKGFGDFKHLCEKHAQAAAEEQVKKARRHAAHLTRVLRFAKTRTAKRRDEKKVLEQRLAARRKKR